jgi:two-component system CheB/CheR fusion protein
LRILRFTPTATKLINLIQGDLGRPVGHTVSNLPGYENLTADVQAVLNTLIPKEFDVQSLEGRWYSMRIQPYRTMDNVIAGAVLTFMDVTTVVQARELLHKANDQLRMAVVIRDAHDAIILQDLDGRIIAWNPGAVRMYGWSETEALTMNVRDRIPEGRRKDALAKLVALGQAKTLESYDTQRITKQGEVVEVSIISTALVNEAGQMYAIATTERAVPSNKSDPSDNPPHE